MSLGTRHVLHSVALGQRHASGVYVQTTLRVAFLSPVDI
ncbi:hypothetical protein PSYAR_23394, partial [Pseudomonas syringae pv. aceris str. M302273]